MATYFSQFELNSYMGVPLVVLAITFPLILYPKTLNSIPNSRSLTMQNQMIFTLTKQLLSPLSKPAHKWALLFTSLMIFLMTLNLMGLLPYTFTPTTQLSLNLGLAFPLWMTTVIMGALNQPTASVAHLLPPGTPPYLIPLLILIETASLLIRPLSLGIRLTANLTAGHLMMQLIASAILALASLLPTVALLTLMLLFLLSMLEIAIAMIQAYVFVLLLTLYTQENT